MGALDDMALFAAVARHGGIRAAAAELETQPSTVSRRLTALEKRLGVRLVTRTSRRFILTEAGSTYYEECRRLVELAQQANAKVGGSAQEPRGLLRIATSPLLGDEVLPPAISAYLRRYPGTSVEVQVAPEYVDIVKQGIDLGIRGGPLDDSSELFAQRLGESLTGVFASPEYLRRNKEPVTPRDVQVHDCIRIGSARGPTSWLFSTPEGDERVPVSGRLAVNSFRMAREAGLRGDGLLRLATFFVAADVEAGRLVPVLTRFWPRITIYAVSAGGRLAPARVKAFVDVLREVFAQGLPWEPPAARRSR